MVYSNTTLTKRLFDIVVSFSSLVLLSPILIAIAIIIKLDGGSVFYKDRRMGLNGKEFNCLKFRSMYLNSDNILKKYLAENTQAQIEWANNHKLITHDPRVTKIGRFIRKTSIDELPQLINVLLGDMSIVGPRPIIVGSRPIIGSEVEKYGKDIINYCSVRPGITGLWQISGRANLSFQERVNLDMVYINTQSIARDFNIILGTIPAMLKQKGAY